MKYQVILTHRFKKSLKKIRKSGSFDFEKYHKVADMLENKEVLTPQYHDHSLQGNWIGFRECHIESDMLLIYRINEEENALIFFDIGSHQSHESSVKLCTGRYCAFFNRII